MQQFVAAAGLYIATIYCDPLLGFKRIEAPLLTQAHPTARRNYAVVT
jgi:hypothetical protein